MGTLGYLRWFQCRHCGWQFYTEKRKASPKKQTNHSNTNTKTNQEK
jgi:hypothetical protein